MYDDTGTYDPLLHTFTLPQDNHGITKHQLHAIKCDLINNPAPDGFFIRQIKMPNETIEVIGRKTTSQYASNVCNHLQVGVEFNQQLFSSSE